MGGHPPAAVWKYTPRELAGWVQLIGEGKRLEFAEQLSLHAMAGRGDPKEIKKILKESERL